MSQQKESKKPYVEPKVMTQGTVQELTQGRAVRGASCLPIVGIRMPE